MKNRKLYFIVSVCVLLLLAFAFCVSAETYGGSCNEGIDWSFNTETGIIEISGNGAVEQNANQPWSEYADMITSVDVKEGITSLPDNMFAECENITTVTLPASLTAIGENAFGESVIAEIICPCNSYAVTYTEQNSIPNEIYHTFGEWKVTKEATVKEDGLKQRKCTRCEESESVSLPKYTNPYKDVVDDCWYTVPALYCNRNGYMSGTGTDTFSPNAPLTREQFVTIVAKIAGADLSGVTYRNIFTDVTDGKWYSKAVVWGYDYGITTGIGNGKFGIGNRVTRQELAVFLASFAHKCGKTTSASVNLSSYSDFGTLGSWARDSFAWAIETGIMKGTTSKTLSPVITATRAQVAVTVKSFCESVLGM